MMSKSPIKEWDGTHRLFTSANILVQQFWALNTDEIQPALLGYSRSEKRLAATGIPIEEETRGDISVLKDAHEEFNLP